MGLFGPDDPVQGDGIGARPEMAKLPRPRVPKNEAHPVLERVDLTLAQALSEYMVLAKRRTLEPQAAELGIILRDPPRYL